MRLRIILLLIATSAAAWHYYGVNRATFTLARSSAKTETAVVQFRCAGKTHCSQMVSCEEATFYLQNCPGVQIDGDGDGKPCESQLFGY